MDKIGDAVEFRARELLHYLDATPQCEEALPFAVGYAIQQMRAAIVMAPPRALSPIRRCRLFRRCAGQG